MLMVMILMCCFLISPPVGEDSLGDVKVDYTCANFTDQLLKSMDMVDVQIPIWVINLKRDVARRDFMVEQLERLGLAYELIEAVDGSTLTDEDLDFYSPKKARKKFGRELTPGELGCSLSHIRLWEKMVKENIPEVLILEDDLLIGKMLLAILENREKLPNDWQHINFVNSTAVKPIGDVIVDIYRACIYLDFPYCAAAYLLTKPGAEKLLEGCNQIYRPIDHYFTVLGLKSYGIVPQVVSLTDFKSSIGKRKSIGIWKRKYQDFKEMILAILNFFGIKSEWIVHQKQNVKKWLSSLGW